jgi:predicted transcriptional regulator
MKQIEIIQKKCKDNNLNIYEVLRQAKVPSNTVFNWTNKNPKAFDTLEKINKTIEKLKK